MPSPATELRRRFFAGREGEFGLLDAAARASGRGEPGHTVVIHGVPGAGKTALLNEYVARLLEGEGQTGNPTIAVPLRPGDLDARDRLNRVAGGASRHT